jgi:hypothetical protein
MRHDAATALRADDDLPSLESLRSTRRARDTVAEPLVERPATAPSRAYGTHRRGETPVAAGYQPGRRTVTINGQAPQPRRRSQTQAAFVAHPDRTALWAFLLAVFLVVMAIATASAGA